MRTPGCFILLLGALATAAPGPETGLQAMRIGTSLRLDGRLDDPAWSRAPFASGFTEEWPQRGRPARQRTEVRVLYDARYLYVGARMLHSRRLEGGRAHVVRRVHRRDQDSPSD